jgi:spore coat protein U-like protein
VLATCQATLPATTFPSFYVAVAEAASNLSVNCTHPTPYNLSLSTGLASAIYLITGKIASHASALVDDALTSYSAHPVSGGRAAGSSTLAGAGNWPVPQLPIDRQTATTLDLASGEYANTVFVNVTY